MKYSQIINLKINKSTLPILIVQGEISKLTLKYSKKLQDMGRSISTIKKVVQSISYMWDFYLTYENSMNNKKSNEILQEFISLRIKGTISNNGLDESLLYWRPVQSQTAKIDLMNLNDFSDYIEQNFNADSLNPVEQKFKGSLEYILKEQRDKKYNLLAHIKPSKDYIDKKTYTREDKFGIHVKNEFKAFPYKSVDELIKISNLREKLIYILLAYGGCRYSEILHIYVDDITLNKNNQTADVTLFNPVEGYAKWNKKGIQKIGKRSEYLRNKYNLEPRT